MRIGIQTGLCGPLARPAAIKAVAAAAEQVGYASVWVVDGPVAGLLLDPVSVLAATAAFTTRVGLGASVRVEPDCDPRPLARSLSTLAVLSEHRLAVALDGPAQPVAAVIDALDRARPTILVAGRDPASLDLAARRADGWMAGSLPAGELATVWDGVRQKAGNRELLLVVGAHAVLTDGRLDGDRPPYHGSAEQVAADVDAARLAGADEVVIGLCGDLCLDDTLDGYARIAEAVTTPVR